MKYLGTNLTTCKMGTLKTTKHCWGKPKKTQVRGEPMELLCWKSRCCRVKPPRPAAGLVIFRGTHPACRRSPSCDTWPQDSQLSQWRERQLGSAQRTPDMASRSLSLGWALSSRNRQWPGELKASVPRVFTGGWSYDTFRLTHTEIPNFQKDNRCPDNWSTESTSRQSWEHREVSQTQVPRHHSGAHWGGRPF